MGRVALPLLKGLAWTTYWAPGRLRLGAGAALGTLLKAGGFRAKVVDQNLAYAFPDSPATRFRVRASAYRHLGSLLLEVLWLFGPLPRFARSSVRVEGIEHWKKARSGGKGVILLSSHVGNWEMMAASSARFEGMNLMLVTKRLKPAWLHEAVEQARGRAGVRATYEPRTLRDVLSHLKAGGTVGIILDQYAGPPVGIRVPVFGIPVSTPSLVALLARRTGVAVLPVVNYRLPDGSYRAQIRPAVPWERADDPGEEIGRNTAIYSDIIEKDILAHPGQWLWTHRRFKGDLSPLRPGEWSEGRARS